MSKIKNSGLDQYGAEPIEQQQFRTAGAEDVRHRGLLSKSHCCTKNQDKLLAVQSTHGDTVTNVRKCGNHSAVSEYANFCQLLQRMIAVFLYRPVKQHTSVNIQQSTVEITVFY